MDKKKLDELISLAQEAISSCCDPCDFHEDSIVGECPDCGFPVDSDGDAVSGCSYSPMICTTCGVRYCDGSC